MADDPKCNLCGYPLMCPVCTGKIGGAAKVPKGCSYPHVREAARVGREAKRRAAEMLAAGGTVRRVR